VLTVAYLANQFPSQVEPYVSDEIEELRRRGVHVIAGSVRRPGAQLEASPEIVLQPISPIVLLRAFWLCIQRWSRVSDLICRALFHGRESPVQRVKALLHTWLGAAYAVMLQGRDIDHIHAHHGYFGSWIAMAAARLLDRDFSFTLHGSDLLLHGSYLDTKLATCRFCLTISQFNRDFILEHYPQVAREKILVSSLGVEVSDRILPARRIGPNDRIHLLAVGRLHRVKDHAFLVQACAELHTRGIDFECSIAGDGPERRRLQSQISARGLEDRVHLLGHVSRQQLDSLYGRADLVVLTSRSEGIPLVLMEAMARGKIVLAPAITGVPELVIHGKTGFLYEPGSLADFVDRLRFIHSLLQAKDCPHSNPYLLSAARQLDWIRHAAHAQVRHNFNRTANLKSFGDLFLARVAPRQTSLPDANLVLQQI
jgi:colanic acid/amylovoran biosynthesis glycosyltransferase